MKGDSPRKKSLLWEPGDNCLGQKTDQEAGTCRRRYLFPQQKYLRSCSSPNGPFHDCDGRPKMNFPTEIDSSHLVSVVTSPDFAFSSPIHSGKVDTHAGHIFSVESQQINRPPPFKLPKKRRDTERTDVIAHRIFIRGH